MPAHSSKQPSITALAVLLLRTIAGQPRPARRLIALSLDTVLCVLSVWIAYSIRVGAWALFTPPVLTVIAVALPSWFVAAWLQQIYRSIIRSTGGRAIIDIARACLLMALSMITVFMFIGIEGIPRTMGFLQPIILLFLLATSRVVLRYLLVSVLHPAERGHKQRVAIFGAGRAGQQLGLALRHESHLTLVCYFDENEGMAGDRLDGVPVVAASAIGETVEELGIDEILLAIPSASRAKRREIVERIRLHPVRVRSLPSIGNIIDGKVSIRDLREIKVEDLLGRDPVPPNEMLLGGAIAGKIVLVSGAGGSIGSELCRQIIERKPDCLVLVEHSEFALYSILSELEEGFPEIRIVPELADVSDQPVVRRIMEKHRPQTVFHAAAYKHVPIVEANPITGVRNNVFGTYHCCEEAERVGVNRFILISTDKAVRPTNIMGTTKRICELILQARAEQPEVATLFSIVRFGNVLSSSGSVVPRFQAQINNGGPVTLTHAEVTRYFMTIPEAAQLVLQAGAMAQGGEVFVLDMGQPVRIADLARSMIQLAGCTVRDAENPDGDVEIREVGLRPGEKLFEELLIGDNPMPTSHTRIMQAREKLIPWIKLQSLLGTVRKAIDDGDVETLKSMLGAIVPDYRPALHENGYPDPSRSAIGVTEEAVK